MNGRSNPTSEYSPGCSFEEQRHVVGERAVLFGRHGIEPRQRGVRVGRFVGRKHLAVDACREDDVVRVRAAGVLGVVDHEREVTDALGGSERDGRIEQLAEFAACRRRPVSARWDGRCRERPPVRAVVVTEYAPVVVGDADDGVAVDVLASLLERFSVDVVGPFAPVDVLVVPEPSRVGERIHTVVQSASLKNPRRGERPTTLARAPDEHKGLPAVKWGMRDDVLDEQRELVAVLEEHGWDVTETDVSVYESPWEGEDAPEATLTLTARKPFGDHGDDDEDEDDEDDDNPFRVK